MRIKLGGTECLQIKPHEGKNKKIKFEKNNQLRQNYEDTNSASLIVASLIVGRRKICLFMKIS